MTTSTEFREFAKDCLSWADHADSDEMRDAFLGMARNSILAAYAAEGGLARFIKPPESPTFLSEPTHWLR
jgi:hypothetical protein